MFSLGEGLQRTIAWYEEHLGASVPPFGGRHEHRFLHLPILRGPIGQQHLVPRTHPPGEPLASTGANRPARIDLSARSGVLHDCTLVQITETIPPEDLFRDYLYFSSYSETYLQHVKVLANRVIAERRLGPSNLVVEVASNDGYLLQNYRHAGVRVLGIEPARNIAKVAEETRQIPTLCEFFGEDLARRLRRKVNTQMSSMPTMSCGTFPTSTGLPRDWRPCFVQPETPSLRFHT